MDFNLQNDLNENMEHHPLKSVMTTSVGWTKGFINEVVYGDMDDHNRMYAEETKPI
ncbi:MAG: hypothetical protein LBM02_09245 [Lachnospiraceae bacterium]|jgi:hypothetical protein|nr:hypothetical protein [Lachnospiraceae bacterium]